MKSYKRITRSLIGLVLLATMGALSFPAGAIADPCRRENQIECINYALDQLQGCIGSPSYCADQFDADYIGCMVLKGCATPPPPIM